MSVTALEIQVTETQEGKNKKNHASHPEKPVCVPTSLGESGIFSKATFPPLFPHPCANSNGIGQHGLNAYLAPGPVLCTYGQEFISSSWQSCEPGTVPMPTSQTRELRL